VPRANNTLYVATRRVQTPESQERGRSLGEDLALETLKVYVQSRRFDSARLDEMAVVCAGMTNQRAGTSPPLDYTEHRRPLCLNQDSRSTMQLLQV